MNRALCFVLVAFGCASTTGASSTPHSASPVGPGSAPEGTAPASAGPTASSAGASALIEARSGSALSGSARFSKAEGGLAAHIELQGAAPGEHGVHVHEKGDCSDPKAVSAGGHFNPAQSPHHGGPVTPVRHGGDLGNITVDSSGKGVLEVVVPGLSLDGPDGVMNRAVVVHEKADDLHSDPAGNSGARIGCGLIQGSQQK